MLDHQNSCSQVYDVMEEVIKTILWVVGASQTLCLISCWPPFVHPFFYNRCSHVRVQLAFHALFMDGATAELPTPGVSRLKWVCKCVSKIKNLVIFLEQHHRFENKTASRQSISCAAVMTNLYDTGNVALWISKMYHSRGGLLML